MRAAICGFNAPKKVRMPVITEKEHPEADRRGWDAKYSTLGAPLGPQWRARMGHIQAQIADSVAAAEMACRANKGVIL